MSVAGRLTFWMTRPEGTGLDLVAACSEQGVETVTLPLMDIEPLSDLGHASRQVMDLDMYSHVIFISANAVRHGMDLIDNYWPQLPIGVQFLAIGQATAKALVARGVDVLTTEGAMNSEALLALPELQAGDGLRKVLIMRGEGGRETLAESLKQRGAQVSYCELYRRVVPNYGSEVISHLFNNIKIDCWLASSAETLNNGLSLAGKDFRQRLCQLPVIVPGERVAEIAKDAGCQSVIVAKNAGTQAVMDALKTLK